MNKKFYTYIMAGKRNGKLYVGVTTDLIKRVSEHNAAQVDGIVGRPVARRLVYFEQYADAAAARRRQNRLRQWHRNWIFALIEIDNPNWCDLCAQIQVSRRSNTLGQAAACHTSALTAGL